MLPPGLLIHCCSFVYLDEFPLALLTCPPFSMGHCFALARYGFPLCGERTSCPSWPVEALSPHVLQLTVRQLSALIAPRVRLRRFTARERVQCAWRSSTHDEGELLLRQGCVPWASHERRAYSVSAATAAASTRREEASAVPTAPWVLFQSLSSRFAYRGTSANGANCEQQDNRHEQHDEERCALVTFLRVPTLLQAFGQLLTFSFARTPVLGFLS